MRGFIYFKLKIFSEKYNVPLPTFYRLTWAFPPAWATQLVNEIAKLYLKSKTRIRGYEFLLQCSA